MLSLSCSTSACRHRIARLEMINEACRSETVRRIQVSRPQRMCEARPQPFACPHWHASALDMCVDAAVDMMARRGVLAPLHMQPGVPSAHPVRRVPQLLSSLARALMDLATASALELELELRPGSRVQSALTSGYGSIDLGMGHRS